MSWFDSLPWALLGKIWAAVIGTTLVVMVARYFFGWLWDKKR